MNGGALAPQPSHGRPLLTHPSPKMHGALPGVPSFAVSPGLTEVEEGRREGERKKTREEKHDSGPSSSFVVGHIDLGGHWQESPPALQNHRRDSDVAKGCAHVMDTQQTQPMAQQWSNASGREAKAAAKVAAR